MKVLKRGVLVCLMLVSGCAGMGNVSVERLATDDNGKPYLIDGEPVILKSKMTETAAISMFSSEAAASVKSEGGSIQGFSCPQMDFAFIDGLQSGAAQQEAIRQFGQCFRDLALIEAGKAGTSAPVSTAARLMAEGSNQIAQVQQGKTQRLAEVMNPIPTLGIALAVKGINSDIQEAHTQQVQAVAEKQSIGDVTIGNVVMSTSGDQGGSIQGEGAGTNGTTGNTGSPESNSIIIGGGANSVAGENGLIATEASNAGFADDSSSASAGLDSEFKGQFTDDNQGAVNNFDDRDAGINNQPAAGVDNRDANDQNASAGIAPF